MRMINGACWRRSWFLMFVLFAALWRDDTGIVTAESSSTASPARLRLRRKAKTAYALVKGHENVRGNNNDLKEQPIKRNSFQHDRPRPGRPQRDRSQPLKEGGRNVDDPFDEPDDVVTVTDASDAITGQAHVMAVRQNDPALDKCFGLLENVSDDFARVTPDQYLEFLSQLTNGQIAPNANMNEVELQYAATFYASSSCTGAGESCDQDTPYISLDSDEANLNSLISLCNSVMNFSFTTVTITFEFTIRYNSELIDKEGVGQCLEIASENLISHSFGCDYGDGGNTDTRRNNNDINNSPIKRKLQLSSTLEQGSVATSQSANDRQASAVKRKAPIDLDDEEEKMIVALLTQEDNDSRFLDMHMSMAPTPPPAWTTAPAPTRAPTPPLTRPPSACPYTVVGTVDSIVEFPCDDAVPQQESITCGIVRMSIEVSAPQSVEPDEDALRAEVIGILRDAINGDGFEEYFPPGCSVSG